LNPLGPLYRLAARLRRARVETGERGEDQAHRYLRSLGFIVVARNWRPPQGGGEVDIVAWEKRKGEADILVFIEVKTRESNPWSAPERAIDEDKIQALRRAARAYLRRAGVDESRSRFDVVSITGENLEHLRDAFPA
jgi:putative endonuclease